MPPLLRKNSDFGVFDVTKCVISVDQKGLTYFKSRLFKMRIKRKNFIQILTTYIQQYSKNVFLCLHACINSQHSQHFIYNLSIHNAANTIIIKVNLVVDSCECYASILMCRWTRSPGSYFASIFYQISTTTSITM